MMASDDVDADDEHEAIRLVLCSRELGIKWCLQRARWRNADAGVDDAEVIAGEGIVKKK